MGLLVQRFDMAWGAAPGLRAGSRTSLEKGGGMAKWLVPAVLGMALSCSAVCAQEAGSVGISFEAGGQAAAGVIWHVTDVFALRPLLTYDSMETTYAYYYGPKTVRVTYYGVDLGLLFRVYSHEKLQLYTGAVLSYDKSDSDWVGDSDSLGGEALFGVRYLLAEHLALYGEVGAQYSQNGGGQDTSSWGLFTGALGVTFYLN